MQPTVDNPVYHMILPGFTANLRRKDLSTLLFLCYRSYNNRPFMTLHMTLVAPPEPSGRLHLSSMAEASPFVRTISCLVFQFPFHWQVYLPST